jgi:hypothetical protein
MIKTVTTTVLLTCEGCEQDKSITLALDGTDAQIDGEHLSVAFIKHAKALGWEITNQRVRCPSCNPHAVLK